MKKFILALIISLASGSAAAQIVKCIEKGKTSFSDSPCPKGAETIPLDIDSGRGKRPAASPPPAIPLAERADAAARERRVREIDFDIDEKESRIKSNIEAMNQGIAKLQKKSASDDNKANALWQQSLATEMRALSMKYQTENNALQYQIEALRAERRSLKSISR